MTLNIEQERLEVTQFNEWVEREEHSASTEDKCNMFTGWLAAKRAAMEGAEPFGWVNAGRDRQQTKHAALIIGVENPWDGAANAFPIYTAPSAPLDAGLMADIKKYLDECLEFPGPMESAVSSEARALLARIDAAPVSAEPRSDEEAEEDAAVIQKLATILAGVCLVLKGPEIELHRHSYHDIVEVAQKIKLELDLFRAREASAEPVRAAQEMTSKSNEIRNRIMEYLGKYGKENTASLLLYEAAKQLKVPPSADAKDSAIRLALQECNRGTSGRLILEQHIEQELRAAIAAKESA